MMIDFQLLATMSNRDTYNKYKRYVKEFILLTESAEMLTDMGKWFTMNAEAEDIDWPSFMALSRMTLHPLDDKVDHEIRESLVKKIESVKVDDNVLERYLLLDTIDKVISQSKEIRDGKSKTTLSDVEDTLIEYHTQIDSVHTNPEDYTIDVDLINKNLLFSDAVEWRIEDLNLSVGPLHKSDFVLITKCPETGGTSFLVSEFTHMLAQLPPGKNAIIFHNEEGEDKVAARIIQSALDITTAEMMSDPIKTKKDWETYLDGRRIQLYPSTDMRTTDVERVLKNGDYWLVGLNVLDKVQGFAKSDEVERLSKLGVWCRGLANKYGSVFAIVQAPASAYGQKWLVQTDIFGNRVKLAGDSDIMLGIGRSFETGDEDLRFINVIRNKKPQTGRMEAARKYQKITAKFDHKTGLYTQ
jgi:hypothetical protein